MTKQLLIIFIKNPEIGKVKTRLAATIGEKEALQVYQELLQHTREITFPLPCDKALFYADFMDRHDEWDNDVYKKFVQEGDDLGEKMHHAFKLGFEMKYESICIIGSDCYELTPNKIIQAFDLLKNHEIVMGPSLDGGYYLLGMNRMHGFLFKNKTWSSPSLMMETVKDIERNNLHAKLMSVLSDVDNEADLKTMKKGISGEKIQQRY